MNLLPIMITELIKQAFTKKNLKHPSTPAAIIPAVVAVNMATSSDGSIESLTMNLATAVVALVLFFYKAK